MKNRHARPRQPILDFHWSRPGTLKRVSKVGGGKWPPCLQDKERRTYESYVLQILHRFELTLYSFLQRQAERMRKWLEKNEKASEASPDGSGIALGCMLQVRHRQAFARTKRKSHPLRTARRWPPVPIPHRLTNPLARCRAANVDDVPVLPLSGVGTVVA